MNTNLDQWDLIIEERDKQKKEKRNKIILVSSLGLLLLLGSTAVAAPIAAVAVNNKNNSTNINNIKIPNTLTFTNSDITTLINGYKTEIQTRKLSLNQFQNDLLNITKKYIVASNIKIGAIVQSVKFTQNPATQNIYFDITLEENDKRQYLTSKDFNEATLVKNILTIQKIDNITTNDFFTETDPIDNTKLNDLLQQIQNWIKDNQFTKEEFENSINDGTLKDKIKDLLGIDADLIGDTKYEEQKLIIEPKSPYTFVSNSNTDLIVDGNIVIPNLKIFNLIKFTNLMVLFDALNYNVIYPLEQKKGDKITSEDFKKYLENNSFKNEIKKFIYDNLVCENKQNFIESDILNIWINDNNELIIDLNNNYLKYEYNEQNNNYFVLNNNQLILKNLYYYFEYNLTEYDFIISNHEIKLDHEVINQTKYISGIADEVKFIRNIVFPEKILNHDEYDIFTPNLFINNQQVETIDMSNLEQWGSLDTEKNNHNSSAYELQLFSMPEGMFYNCYNLKKIILPKNTRVLYENLFQSCVNLKTIDLPDSLKEIWNYAFANTGLESIVIPPNLIGIAYGAFSGSKLKWAKISSKIKEINVDAFKGTLQSITIYVPTQELKQHYESLNLSNVQEIIVGEPPTN